MSGEWTHGRASALFLFSKSVVSTKLGEGTALAFGPMGPASNLGISMKWQIELLGCPCLLQRAKFHNLKKEGTVP